MTCLKCSRALVYWVIVVDGKPHRSNTSAHGAEGPYGEHAAEEHPGECCGCFDVGWGMDDDCRMPDYLE